jgi:small subunit ribosomal protein S16
MLVIRLARGGRSKYPTYRIVAAESSRAATGKFVEVLGHYNPHTKELVIDKEGVEKRLSNGAQPSNTVIKLLQREKIELPAWAKLKTQDRKPKKEPVVKEPKAEEPKVEPAAEKPAEETPEAAPAKEERVAEAATENAAETEDKATPAGKTETAEDTEAAAEAVEKVEAAGDVAVDTAEPETEAAEPAAESESATQS